MGTSGSGKRSYFKCSNDLTGRYLMQCCSKGEVFIEMSVDRKRGAIITGVI